MNKELILDIATDHGWELVFEHTSPMVPLLRFKKGEKKIDVWFTSGTVGIYEPCKKGVYERDYDITKIEKLLS